MGRLLRRFAAPAGCSYVRGHLGGSIGGGGSPRCPTADVGVPGEPCPRIVPVDEATSYRAGEIYTRWGKGLHPAALNYCDCFSYDVAKQLDCPLLYIGNDFSQTDIVSALA